MKTQSFFVHKETIIQRLQRSIGEAPYEFMELMDNQRFMLFAGMPELLYDHQLELIWYIGKEKYQEQPNKLDALAAKIRIGSLKSWEVPYMRHLRTVAEEEFFISQIPYEADEWIYAADAVNLKAKQVKLGADSERNSLERCPFIPVHYMKRGELYQFMDENKLVPLDQKGIQHRIYLTYMLTRMIALENDDIPFPIPSDLIKQWLLEGDFIRARLPKLEETYLTDTEKGLWKLYSEEDKSAEGVLKIPMDRSYEARDPKRDVQSGAIAIDFGTSSTVVACRKNGKVYLLRVGMHDLFKKEEPSHYENPTILEFIHLPNLVQSWKGEVYRPLTNWDDFHFSHEALNDLRNNETDVNVVGSMMTSIKQWPLRSENEPHLRLIGQRTGKEWEFPPQQEIFPEQGKPMEISDDYPFDPIELYAYYLGLFINHSAHGLFLDYYMTFPIAYPIEVKRKILAAFSRGLQRSLPESLVKSKKFKNFSVQEIASEPAAFAACALEEEEIEPTEEGVAYGVFDFGGGTTDFDFGIYRLPTEDEEYDGYEHAIEHFGASGDRFLGGENLIDHLAYLTFQLNLDVCREKKVPFTKPLDADIFPGSEMLLDQSSYASTNSILLKSQLRYVWEGFKKNSSEQKENLLLQMLDRTGQKVEVELRINQDELRKFLVERLTAGVHTFYSALKNAFTSQGELPEQIHIFLAGNSCQSEIVKYLFGITDIELEEDLKEKLKDFHQELLNKIFSEENVPELIVHPPLLGDPNNVYKPTTKTGVAIGLLKLIPGESMLEVSQVTKEESGQAPFQFYVGRFLRRKFKPLIQQNGKYNEWQEFGPAPGNVFVLGITRSSLAIDESLIRGSSELGEHSIHLEGELRGHKLYARAINPDTVEVCMAPSLNDAVKGSPAVSNLQTITLS